MGFGPVGTVLGRSLAQPGYKWLLVPIGMLIGFFIVKAEPAIQVLNRQIQSVTSGAISARAMNRCLSIGVSVSVGLAMLRVVTGIPVAYILLPGYVLALGLSFVVPPIFVGIAFDSGGVASGCIRRGGAGGADPADRRSTDGRRLPNQDEPRREAGCACV